MGFQITGHINGGILMVSRTKVKQKTNDKIPTIYVGPDLPHGVLKRHTVFKGEYPPYVEELRQKSPSLCGLFVSLDKLSDARRRVGVQGDLLNTLSKQIFKEI